jgi:hypothetical protein
VFKARDRCHCRLARNPSKLHGNLLDGFQFKLSLRVSTRRVAQQGIRWT